MKKLFIRLFSLIILLAMMLGCVKIGAIFFDSEHPFTFNLNVTTNSSTNPEQSSTIYQTSTATAVFQRCLPSVVKLETNLGGGSGFFIGEELVVTNQHVIDNAQWVNVINSTGNVFSAVSIVAQSVSPDLALLEVPGAKGTPVEYANRTLLDGETIYAMGNPMGIFPCIFDGIVVKSRHNDGNTRLILSNLNTYQGISGGPVFDSKGMLIGVAVGGISDGNNDINMIINADHIPEMDRSRSVSLRTRIDVIEEQNRPPESKYPLLPLDQAHVGSLVSFGRYEQDNNFTNGSEDILWLVMEEHEDRLVLMSLYCLDAMPYSLDGRPAGWEDSSVRTFLNTEFYHSAFSENEKYLIRDTLVVTPENPVYHNFCSEDTVDKVYLMDHYEAMRYFNIPEPVETFYEQTAALATPYTITKDVWLENPNTNHCWMWLRSNGSSSSNGGEIGSYGYLSFNGGDVEQIRALRPLIQIKRDAQ